MKMPLRLVLLLSLGGCHCSDGGFDALGTGMGVWGSLTYVGWTGGDELRVESDGMRAVGMFSGQVKTPLDFEDLSPSVFWDGGAAPIGNDFTMSWTPGGASSITIDALDEVTLGESCAQSDNASISLEVQTQTLVGVQFQ